MGSTLSARQKDLRRSHFDRVVLMLDGDEADRRGADAIVSALASTVPVYAVALHESAQPDQLTLQQIVDVLTPALRGTV